MSPNMCLEYLVRVLYCGFAGFISVFAVNVTRRQNEGFLWTEHTAENSKNIAGKYAVASF